MKLIFVEGPPGSGKTTYAHKLKEKLKNNNVKYYGEHIVDGIDISCQAYLSREEFDNYLKEFDLINKSYFKSNIIENTKFLKNNKCLVSYPYIQSEEIEICNLLYYLYDKEISNRGVNFSEYYTLVKEVWNNFFTKEEILQYDFIIFEGALIHTHLFNLKGYYNATVVECIDFISELLKTINNKFEYSIHIIYSKEYPSRRIIDNKRVDNSNSWEVGFNRWLLNAPCIGNKTDILKFCNQCNEIYYEILGCGMFNAIEIERGDYNA